MIVRGKESGNAEGKKNKDTLDSSTVHSDVEEKKKKGRQKKRGDDKDRLLV